MYSSAPTRSQRFAAVSCAPSCDLPGGATAPPDPPKKRLRRAPEALLGGGSRGAVAPPEGRRMGRCLLYTSPSPRD
eukprot:1228477-Alexandrium_andersonii.AAC.1